MDALSFILKYFIMPVIAVNISLAYSAGTNDNVPLKAEEELKRIQDTIDYSADNKKITLYAEKYADLAKRSGSKYHKAKAFYNTGVSNGFR